MIEIIDNLSKRDDEVLENNEINEIKEGGKLIDYCYEQFLKDPKREEMLEGLRYYNNKTKIDEKTRFTHAGSKGKVVDKYSELDEKLSNAKAHKNFMRKLTRQKVTYLLGKPYTIETEDETYKKLLEDKYFEKNTYRMIFNLLKESIKEGINWINVYYDENGDLQFRRVPRS